MPLDFPAAAEEPEAPSSESEAVSYDVPGPESPALLADADDSGGSSLFGDAAEVTCSGADVTINMEQNAHISVAEIPPRSLLDGTDAPPDEEPSTMVSALIAILGPYTPKVQTVSTYFNGQLLEVSTQYVPGLAGLDVEWLAGAVIFTVFLYCLMRLLGGILA